MFVEADGRADGPDLAGWTGTRLFDMSAEALTASLRLLAAAAGHQAPPAALALRAELTIVTQNSTTGDPDGIHGIDGIDGQNSGTDNRAPSGDREPSATGGQTAVPNAPELSATGNESVSAPRLVLVDDPFEASARDALEAWATRPVRVSVLGALRIEANGQPVTKLRSQAWAVAALLAWKGVGGVSDEQIDGMCWPDQDDLERVARWRQDGFKSLRARLRESTGRKTAQFVPLRDRRDYVLNPEYTAVDLWVFRALDAAAGSARTSADRLHWLEKAVGFCAGELLSEETGAVFAWADSPRVTVRAEQVGVLTRYATHAAEADQPDKALAALRRAAAITDDAEYIYRRMFDLLAALGRHAEIAAQMEVLNASADEMGAMVDPATREHAARLLRPGGRHTVSEH